MSLEAILARLVELTQPLANGGQIHDYERMHIAPEDVQHVHGIADQLSPRGWSIRSVQWYRRGRPGAHLDPSGYLTEYTHHIHARILWELNDAAASERDWRTMTEALCALFSSPLTLDGYAHRFTYPQVVFEGQAIVTDVYTCHDMELTMDITEKADTSDYDTTP